jgi:hypothetical protein
MERTDAGLLFHCGHDLPFNQLEEEVADRAEAASA